MKAEEMTNEQLVSELDECIDLGQFPGWPEHRALLLRRLSAKSPVSPRCPKVKELASEIAEKLAALGFHRDCGNNNRQVIESELETMEEVITLAAPRIEAPGPPYRQILRNLLRRIGLLNTLSCGHAQRWKELLESAEFNQGCHADELVSRAPSPGVDEIAREIAAKCSELMVAKGTPEAFAAGMRKNWADTMHPFILAILQAHIPGAGVGAEEQLYRARVNSDKFDWNNLGKAEQASWLRVAHEALAALHQSAPRSEPDDFEALVTQHNNLVAENGKLHTMLQRIADTVALAPTITGLQKACVNDHSIIWMAIRDAQDAFKDTLARKDRELAALSPVPSSRSEGGE